jgi:hypothetical protein
MKMRTSQAVKIRMFLAEFVCVKLQYSNYLSEKLETDKQMILAKHKEKIENLQKNHDLTLMQQKMTIIQTEYDIKLLQKDMEIAVLQNNIEVMHKINKINTLEKNVSTLQQNMTEILPNTVVLPGSVEKRQQFCLIDSGNNKDGRAIKRQRCTFEIAKQKYLLSCENSKVLLEIPYSANATYLLNKIREFVKSELDDKISIINSTVKVLSSEYNLKMFVQDLQNQFHEQFKHCNCIIY